jgi:prepilin-type N-terminal cleavage/methylation domain-containing protein
LIDFLRVVHVADRIDETALERLPHRKGLAVKGPAWSGFPHQLVAESDVEYSKGSGRVSPEFDVDGMRRQASNTESQRGFSLVELAIVVLIVAVLAAFAIPRLLRSVERSRAAEAFHYLTAIRAAQERYQAQHGRYTSSTGELDADLPPLHYFVVEKREADETSWKLVLRRVGPSGGYAEYTVVFEEDGYNRIKSTIPPELMPVDLQHPAT